MSRENDASRQMNDALCDFALRWKVEGEWLTCTGCKRSKIASRVDEVLPHAHGCTKAATSEPKPWAALMEILRPIYIAPQPAAPSVPTRADSEVGRLRALGWEKVEQPAAPSVPQGEPAAWMMVNRNHPTIGSSLQWTPPLDWHITWEAHPLYTTPQPAAPSVPAGYGLRALALAEGVLDCVEEPPDKNCSCHISPPCRDCYNYSSLRELLALARETLKAPSGGEAGNGKV